MAEISRGWIAFISVSAIIGLLVVAGPDTSKVLFRLLLALLFSLAILSFLISTIYPRLKKVFVNTNNQHTQTYTDIDNTDLQNKARDALQEEHAQKATSYNERILKPRQEAKLQQKEEEFRRHLGPAWKGRGQKLGTDDPSTVPIRRGAGSSRDAAQARKLPEPEPKPQPREATEPQSKPLRRKKVIELPPEPPEDSTSQVTVMLRTPQGRFYQRRFDTSNRVQVLLDYMTTIGYHQSLYTLIMSYPRRSLDGTTEKTLAEAEITGRVTLNVDRRDPDD